jgi:hypothetical protein
MAIVECDCCGCYHRFEYAGDCRNDSERFNDLEDAAGRLKMPVVEISADGNFLSMSQEVTAKQIGELP